MKKKVIFSILFFYFLVLLQTSFFVHFCPEHLNLTLIVIALVNVFEDRKENFGIFSAFIGGFFLDIFSEKTFGYYIFLSICISLFIKFIFKKYIYAFQK